MGITAKAKSITPAAAIKISGAGMNAVVIVSAEEESGNGIFIALFIALPTIGPTSIGTRTLKTILTP